MSGFPAWPPGPRWIAACSVGEAIGYGVAALAAGVSLLLFPDDPNSFGPMVLLVLGGLLEGAVLGTAQAFHWAALRPVRRQWITATAAVAAVGWGLTGLGQGMAGDQGSSPPDWWLVVLLAALLGAVLGAIFGWVQGSLVRRRARSRPGWVLANTVGWALAMPILFWAPMNIPADAGLVQFVGYGMLSGVLGGLVVGLSTVRATLQRPTMPSGRAVPPFPHG